MLSFFGGDGYEHVSTSLLGIIGIHKGEATSIIWIVAAALEPHATRMRRGRDVSSGPVRAHGMQLRLISTTRLTKNVGLCPEGPSFSGCQADICGLGIGGATGLFSTPDAAR